MNDYIYTSYSESIWSELFNIENSNKSKNEQINIIKNHVIRIVQDAKLTGRRQILNHIKSEIESLES